MPTRDTRIAPTASEISTSVPTMLGWLASLTMGGALVAASMIVLPFWPIQHKPVDLGVAAVLLPVGLAMWFARKRAPGWAIHAGLLLGIGSTTASVWATGPTAASQSPALYYGFLIAFAGVFLRRRLALTYVALAGGLYLAALTFFGIEKTQAFTAMDHPGYKHFVRLRVRADGSAVDGWCVGLADPLRPGEQPALVDTFTWVARP